MKKYRVITDNLDWRDIRRGRIILVEKNLKSYRVEGDFGLVTWLEHEYFENLLKKHPDWFEEVIDSPKEYSASDMIEYGEFLRITPHKSTFEAFTEYIVKYKRIAVTGNIHEPKYTKDDMKRAYDAGEMRGDYLAAENGFRMLGRMVKFEQWFENKYERLNKTGKV